MFLESRQHFTIIVGYIKVHKVKWEVWKLVQSTKNLIIWEMQNYSVKGKNFSGFITEIFFYGKKKEIIFCSLGGLIPPSTCVWIQPLSFPPADTLIIVCCCSMQHFDSKVSYLAHLLLLRRLTQCFYNLFQWLYRYHEKKTQRIDSFF